jgi:putative peptidoglycan lipid II flippase
MGFRVKEFSVPLLESPVSEDRNLTRAAGVVGFYTLLSRILGLARDMVVAAFFGSGMVADAFFVAFRIPNLLRRLFAEGSLTISFIPVFTEYLRRKSEREAFDLARTVLALLSVALVAVTALGILLAPWIVRIQAFGFGGAGAKYELTVLLTRITFPYILFISLVAFFMGVLNSLRHFAAPAAAPIFLNLGIIGATVLISPHLHEPIVGVAAGVLIGGFLQVMLQVPWVLKKGLSLLPKWDPHHPAVRRIGRLMVPAIFGSAVYQLNQFTGTLLASFLPDGSVSWLYYADRLVQFPLGVFAIAISTAALPSLSSQVADRRLDEFGETLTHAMGLIFFIALPSTIGLVLLGKPIIELFFERGAFDAHSTAMTNEALVFYAMGLWAFSGIRVMVSGFYALQDTKTPVKVAFVALLANLLFSLLLMGPLKHGGLALALSLASALQCGLLVFLFKQKVKTVRFSPVFLSVLRSLVASGAMGIALYCTRQWFLPLESIGPWRMTVHLGVLVGIGGTLYFVVARILGCREVASIRHMLGPVVGGARQACRKGDIP